jgi:predicted nuclease of predicted toxin-antitoxin system
MRVKIDENMPVDAVRLLVGAGRDTSTVYDEHLVGAADRRVIEASRQKRRVLVSLDVDFPDIRRYPPEDWSGMVVLRPGEPGRDSVLALLATALPAFATEPVRQRLWIVQPNRIRIRGADQGAV